MMGVYEFLCNNSTCAVEGSLTVFCFQDYLSDVEFKTLLGTSRLEFEELPKWRQNELKKKAGLF